MLEKLIKSFRWIKNRIQNLSTSFRKSVKNELIQTLKKEQCRLAQQKRHRAAQRERNLRRKRVKARRLWPKNRALQDSRTRRFKTMRFCLQLVYPSNCNCLFMCWCLQKRFDRKLWPFKLERKPTLCWFAEYIIEMRRATKKRVSIKLSDYYLSKIIV